MHRSCMVFVVEIRDGTWVDVSADSEDETVLAYCKGLGEKYILVPLQIVIQIRWGSVGRPYGCVRTYGSDR